MDVWLYFERKERNEYRRRSYISKGKGLETCSGCGYIYTYIYIHLYGTIGEFRVKQDAGLTKPTKHTQKTVFMAL